MAVSLCNDLLFLIRQFFYEEKLLETAHVLEKEAGFYFDMSYFEGLVLSGEWKEAEKYLSGFCGVHDNNYSVKIYFELRKQEYLEALDKHDPVTALDILMKDLKVFDSSNPELYREMTVLLSMDDFRKHSLLSTYGDVISARKRLMDEIKAVIEANPQFDGKLEFPQLEKSRLRRLINQSLNWQHVNCANPLPEPHIETLFTDHRCLSPSNIQNPAPSQSVLASVSTAPGELVLGDSSLPESCITANADSNVSAAADADNGNSPKEDVTFEGIKDSGNASKVLSSLAVNQMDSFLGFPIQCQSLKSNVPDGFPNTVERSMEMSSLPTSMEFHPSKHTLLLVGNRNGEIELWDISYEAKMFWNAFTIWRREAISTLFLKEFDKDPCILVNRVSWSPDGSVFGVGFSKNIVQLYSYHAMTNYTEKRLEIDAHLGGVNDLAFSSPDDQLLVITCGDDKFIQVWNAMTGTKQFTCEGHSAPVYSLCTHHKKDIHFLFSTSTNGEIRAWLFDNSGPKVQFNAPGRCCMRMAYSDDCKRLFSCGTNKEGESYIVEWNDIEGHIIRIYTGLSKSSVDVVQFCINRSRFLAAGDEHLIKIWDMDKVELLAVIDADGGLPARPHLSFNREGTILAVFADHNKIKILANNIGRQQLQPSRFGSSNPPGYLLESLEKVGKNPCPASVRVEHENIAMEAIMKPQVPFELNKVLGTQKCPKIVEVSRCQSLMLPSDLKTNKISRLTYTYSGNGILALGEDGIHLLWRWLPNNCPVHEKQQQATTSYAPRQWQPSNGLVMINDVSSDGFKPVSPCFALSKNDSYLASSSGKMISLFNAITFKKIRSCMPSPPAATCLGFYPPDNNIIAIGLDDATILIYNLRMGEVINRLRGHVGRISGFAFSSTLKVLVSSGVDTQIIVWDCNRWEKNNITMLQISSGWMPSETSETYIQFYQDQLHFLAVHETQLAVYDALKLDRVKQWIIGDFCTRISHAALSCDNQLVYAVMRNGIVLILGASDLSPRFEIDPSIYIPSGISYHAQPLVISAHPQKPNQIALGLSNGGVVVLEPVEPQGTWVVQPPANNGALANRPVNL